MDTPKLSFPNVEALSPEDRARFDLLYEFHHPILQALYSDAFEHGRHHALEKAWAEPRTPRVLKWP